jgi:hypothetical protein
MFAQLIPAEEQAKLDDKGMEALNKEVKAMFSGLRGSGSSYSYDAHGRIVETRERNFAFEKITTILYNAQGDKSEERRAITDNRAYPGESSFPLVPKENDKFQYSYQYDNHGNWVELTVNHGSRAGESGQRVLSRCQRTTTAT